MHSRSLLFVLVLALLVGALAWFFARGERASGDIAAVPGVEVSAASDGVDASGPDLDDEIAIEASDVRTEVADERAAPSTDSAADAHVPMGVFDVRVVSVESGAALAGVEVLVSMVDGSPRGTTDEDGRVEVAFDTHRRVNALVALPSSTSGRARIDDLPDVLPGETASIEIEVTEGWSVSGRCVDERGIAVAGATVRGWCRSSARGMHARETTSDADGRWRLDHLGPEVWIVAQHTDLGLVARDGLQQNERPTEPAIGFELVLVPAVDAVIEVVDPRGAPVADARILDGAGASTWREAHVDGSGYQSNGDLDVRTDDDGRALVTGLPPRVYSVDVTAAGFRRYRELRTLDGSPIRVVLDEGYGVAGRVVDADGEPAVDAEVRLGPSTHGATRYDVVRTDAAGRFRAVGLERPDALRHPPWIVVHHDGHAVEVVQPIEIAPSGNGREVLVELSPGASITGRVLLDGRPVDGAMLWVESPREMDADVFQRPSNWEVVGGGGDAWAEGDGSFALTHLFRETYTVHVRPSYDVSNTVTFEVEAGTQGIDLELTSEALRGVVVHGTVTDAITGEPIPRFGVGGYREGETEGRDGSYELVGIAPGNEKFSFWAKGYLGHRTEWAEYVEGEYRLDVRLVPTASLAVEVVDASGAPWGDTGMVELDVAPALAAALGDVEPEFRDGRRTNGAPVRFDDVPAGALEVTVDVPGDRVTVPVDLSGGGAHTCRVVVDGASQHVHTLLVLEHTDELDPREIVRRLRSDAPDDVEWIAAQREVGALRDPSGDVSIRLVLRRDDGPYVNLRAYLRPHVDHFRIQRDSYRTEDTEEPRIEWRLVEGDWSVVARIDRDDGTQLFDPHVDLSPQGAELDVILFEGEPAD